MEKSAVRFSKWGLASKATLGVGLLLASGMAMAAPVAGAVTDPMAMGVCGLYKKLNGQVLFGFAMACIFGLVVATLWQGEVTEAIKKVATVLFVVGLIMGSAVILQMTGVATC